MHSFLLTSPDRFMQKLMENRDWTSLATAKKLDEKDPLHYTAALFNIDEIVPFAGHSLGPLFLPTLNKIKQVAELQKKLHDGHFSTYYIDGEEIGQWFECDRQQSSVDAAKALLGFEHEKEFIFTASGLSQNLLLLMDTFFKPGKKDWESGKTKIIMLDQEFYSDQAAAYSVIKRAIRTADQFEYFTGHKKPSPEEHLIKIKADQKGIFHLDTIINTIQKHAAETQMICLSDIVFNTGQRLDLKNIFLALTEIIIENNIIVGLDLAHTIGNRPIDLKSFPVTFAVGCAYKHLCGFAGSSFGIYVNQNVDLEKYPPLQGWKAANSSEVFSTIHCYRDHLMEKAGAVAFRASNPAPVALAPVQAFLQYFNRIGFDKCFNKSECLTRYLIALINHCLSDQIEWITPENPSMRGAMIVFSVKSGFDVRAIEHFLKNVPSPLGQYEIDVRPPNNVRLSAHYAYTQFSHINNMVEKLKLAINDQGAQNGDKT